MDHFGYGTTDFVLSEISGGRCVDIHHIDCRGMGGKKKKYNINELVGLTRDEHIYFGDKEQYMDFLTEVHNSFLTTQVPWAETNPDCPILKEYINGLI